MKYKWDIPISIEDNGVIIACIEANGINETKPIDNVLCYFN